MVGKVSVCVLHQGALLIVDISGTKLQVNFELHLYLYH